VSKPMPLEDFRAVRIVLEPADFALGDDEPDLPPSDVILNVARDYIAPEGRPGRSRGFDYRQGRHRARRSPPSVRSGRGS
jgi:hypothetical protein